MGGRDVEPDRRVLEGLGRLRQLLRRADGLAAGVRHQAVFIQVGFWSGMKFIDNWPARVLQRYPIGTVDPVAPLRPVSLRVLLCFGFCSFCRKRLTEMR